MTKHSHSQPSLKSLQEQFRNVCLIGMRGAEAISSFRENPKEKLATVKECTAQIQAGISGLRTDLEASLVSLSNGEKIFLWEYQSLKDIAANAGLTMEQIEDEDKIQVQNGSVVRLDLDYTQASDLTPLANLSALRQLSISGCMNISDLTPIANLSSLQDLILDDTLVSDLTPLSSLSTLKKLRLQCTPAITASRYIITALKNRGVKVIKERLL